MTIVRKAPLDFFITSLIFILKTVSPRFKYANGQRTDVFEGYNYIVVNTQSYDTFTVKTNETTPVITPEDLRAIQATGQNVIVEISGATVSPYYSTRTKAIEDSIWATSVRLVEDFEM